MVERAEGINIAHVENGEATGLFFRECEATGKTKTVVVNRSSRRKAGRRAVMT